MNKLTLPTSEVDSPNDSKDASPRVEATLYESALGDQVTLWTDWDHNGGTFPVEYLAEIIEALQGLQIVQAIRAGTEAKA